MLESSLENKINISQSELLLKNKKNLHKPTTNNVIINKFNKTSYKNTNLINNEMYYDILLFCLPLPILVKFFIYYFLIKNKY